MTTREKPRRGTFVVIRAASTLYALIDRDDRRRSLLLMVFNLINTLVDIVALLLIIPLVTTLSSGTAPSYLSGPNAIVSLPSWVLSNPVVAIGGESLADQQMKAFRQDPANRGKVCDTGLWAWSRHPNYLFEWLGWFAYPAMALSLSGYPEGWLSLLAPLVMFGVLRFGTGVPPLEAHMERSRGEAFRAYQARVPVFFPRFPGVPR